MFYINLWGFSTNPLIWVITLKNRKHLFCVFLRFRDLLELKQSEAFSGVIIFPRATKWEEEAHEGSHEAQTILDGVGPWPSRVTQVRLTVVPLMTYVFVPDWLSWPKKSYINTPRGVPSRRRQRNLKPWNRYCTCEGSREKLYRSRPRSLL
jgi:hypothetical protein